MRENIDKYFIKMANLVGTRGTCNRGHSGCVIVKNKQVISTGYVGAPKGLPHCDKVGHEIEKSYDITMKYSEHCVRTTHAEQNAIVNAAKNGVSTDGATLYCTMEPCYACAKMIINSGIKKVVADYEYHVAEKSRGVLCDAGVNLITLRREVKRYEEKEKPETNGDNSNFNS